LKLITKKWLILLILSPCGDVYKKHIVGTKSKNLAAKRASDEVVTGWWFLELWDDLGSTVMEH